MSTQDYAQFAGRCKEMSEAEVQADPTLRLVRGWYHCPVWGPREHWWTVRASGEVHDVTVRQFPTWGNGATYEEYAGVFPCRECGAEVKEEDVVGEGFCSDKCYARCVGMEGYL